MKINKKYISILAGSLFFAFSVGSSASLIQYDAFLSGQVYWSEHDSFRPDDVFVSPGQVVVDTEKFAFVSIVFDEYPMQVDWQGEATFSLQHGGEGWQPGHVRQFFEFGTSDFTWWFDTSRPAGTNPLEMLDSITAESRLTYQSYFESGSFGGLANVSFTNKTTLVPEPAILSLLFLGLATIGIRRRLRTDCALMPRTRRKMVALGGNQ